ncbi:MAG: hypothetical protein IK062_05370 [Selenomonadaceae bacterium]|nr:hypothetical protein [Selenomonadaceae bacterium]
MLAKKNLQKKVSDVQEKNFKNDDMILTEEESVHFKDEINKQLAETKIIDIGKAMRNARYLAMLDRGFADNEGVTFTFEELEKFMNEIRKI